MVTLSALTIVGCAASGEQRGATRFLDEHGPGMTRAAAAAKVVETDVSGLPRSPSRPLLERLSRAARKARHNAVQAGEWNVAEGGEEEDLQRAKAEMTEGANELANAMSPLLGYARAPTAAAGARAESELARGREEGNGGISELWSLAHKSTPPIV